MQQGKQDPILQTLALTAKIERNMKQLISCSKLDQEQQEEDYSVSEESKGFSGLKAEVERLQQENRQLIADNQQLCRDMLRMKEERRSLRTQLAEQKQYVGYLQNYLKDIKNQLLFWMRKPTFEQKQSPPFEPSDFKQLLTQVIELRKQNDSQQVLLKTLKGPHTKQICTPVRTKHKRFIQADSRHRLDQSSKNQSFKKKDKCCTSCNYRQSGGRSEGREKRGSHHRTVSQQNLCQCHQEFLKTGKFEL